MVKENYFTPGNIRSVAMKMMADLRKSNKKQVMRFVPEVSALLVIDMQGYFLDPNSHAFLPSAKAIIPNVKNLINVFCGKRPIIFTQHINTQQNAKMLRKWWDDIITTDNDYYKLSSELYFSGAPVVVKTQYDAFYRTKLNELLHKHQVKQIIITGVMANLCCETTARSAFIHGFEVFFVIDGTATVSRAMHKATLLNLSYGFAIPVLTQDIIKKLRKECQNV